MRRLSDHQAVQTMIKILVPLCTVLEEETEKRGCAKASGLLNNLRNWRTVLILQTLSSVLPALADLSKQFQVKLSSFWS